MGHGLRLEIACFHEFFKIMNGNIELSCLLNTVHASSHTEPGLVFYRFAGFRLSSRSIAGASDSGFAVDAQRSTTFPSREMRNFS